MLPRVFVPPHFFTLPLEFARLVWSWVLGVGKDEEDALSEMSRTKGGAGYNIPPQIIAERGNFSNDSVEVGKNKDAWRVFKDREAGS
jgi:hypothetical protein